MAPQIISVHSFRGGTGKSNTTANLSTLLAMEGKRVGIVDTDIQSPGIHVLFSLDEKEMVHSLENFLEGKYKFNPTAMRQFIIHYASYEAVGKQMNEYYSQLLTSITNTTP